MTADEEKRLLDVVRKHDDLLAKCRDLGVQVQSVQGKLSALGSFSYSDPRLVHSLRQERERLVSKLATLKIQRNAAGVERNIAERKLRTPDAEGRPVVPERPKPALIEAQVAHFRLLASSVRDEQLKVTVRHRAAMEFVAAVEPIL